MDNLSKLNEEETSELRALADAHAEAKAAGDYAKSDALRKELMEWGAWPPGTGWLPVSESPAHRLSRWQKRNSAAHEGH